ncbi:MAG TPA: MFS transporter, partial [Planctomycetota bacterium]|nr:MFS transporter [Planctomycetota bacterium]
LLQAGSPVAMALAAAVGCFVAPRVGWRPCYLWSALPGLLVFAARWALPLPAAGERAPAPAAALLFRVPLRRASVVLLLVLVLHMTGFWCVYAWLPQALAHDAGATPSQVGVFQIEVNTVHVLADIAFGWLAVRYGRIRTFVGFCLLFAAGQTLVAATLPTLLLDRTLLTVAICAMGLGAGSWSCFGALFGALYPAALRATAAATFYNLARGAQLFSQPLMGVLFTTTGSFAPALWIGAVCALASALVVRWLPAAARTHAGSEQVGSV